MGSTQSTQRVRGVSGKRNAIVVSKIGVESITFESAHEGMHRNDRAENWSGKDWGCTGTPYAPPHWASGKNAPISHTRNKLITLRVELYAAHSGIRGRLVGDPVGEANDVFKFRSDERTLGAETNSVRMVGEAPLPCRLRTIEQSIRWTFEKHRDETNSDPDEASGKAVGLTVSGPHTVFLTFDTPVTTGGYEEQGATPARMGCAMQKVDGNSEDNSVDLIKNLFDEYERFVLGEESLDKELQDEILGNAALQEYIDTVDWPRFQHGDPKKRARRQRRYLGEAFRGKRSLGDPLRGDNEFRELLLREQGGAWPLASLHRYGGECQAIVRLIRGILHQVGFREGTIDVRYVTAHFDDPNNVIIGETSACCCQGPRKDRLYALGGGEIKTESGTASELNANLYEAYMRYRYQRDGSWRQAWFGGGVGMLGPWEEVNGDISQEEKNRLLNTFGWIAEFEDLGRSGGKDMYKITNVKEIQKNDGFS